MNNTADTTKYTKVTKHTSWQEVVPFLRTGDIVTIHCRTGETERDARVCVRNTSPLITAGYRYLRYPNGTFSAAVTSVILHTSWVAIDELEPLATSLKSGDIVRATFVYTGSSAVTLEGTVKTDEDGDAVLVVADAEGDDPEIYYLTFGGRIARALRALEVIDPDEDADMGLPPEPEPLPVHQVRLQPGTGYAWQKLPHGWECAQLAEYLTDDDVRSWPVMEIIAGDDKDIETTTPLGCGSCGWRPRVV